MEEQIKSKLMYKWIWIIALLIVVLIAALWWMGKLAFGATIYQAVFLTNDQVYFGKLSNQKSAYPVLKNIFYLQATRPLQPQDMNSPPLAGGQIQLVKLGNELHGPVDEMKINRDHILFIEDLKPDSQVVKAIEAFKKNQPQ